jgi:hypothetical protein
MKRAGTPGFESSYVPKGRKENERVAASIPNAARHCVQIHPSLLAGNLQFGLIHFDSLECTARKRHPCDVAERFPHRGRSLNIANLPAEIRDELNWRINNGKSGEPFGVGAVSTGSRPRAPRGAGGMSRKESYPSDRRRNNHALIHSDQVGLMESRLQTPPIPAFLLSSFNKAPSSYLGENDRIHFDSP